QILIDKVINLSIHYAIHVRSFIIRTVIFYHIIGMKNVGSDLGSPFYFILGIFQLLFFALFNLFLQLIDFCTQQHPSFVSILFLGTLLLALSHYLLLRSI